MRWSRERTTGRAVSERASPPVHREGSGPGQEACRLSKRQSGTDPRRSSRRRLDISADSGGVSSLATTRSLHPISSSTSTRAWHAAILEAAQAHTPTRPPPAATLADAAAVEVDEEAGVALPPCA